ncbi:unnamed protein product [Rotaria magnacalcarata]|uniref:Uncharacterized protein n=1 Tax=Rotaria magnacalcarata TaxID=392030 RepID=A0A819UCN9_9BILA|nr:unnamed protein product [Rotaria magnacalcarata]
MFCSILEGLKKATSGEVDACHDRDGVLNCFKYKNSDVVAMMEITSDFGFNPVLPPPLCTLFEYFSKPEYGIHQMNQK